MFFYLNGHTDLLPEVEPGLHLDAGWSSMEIGHCKLYYKGYTDKGNLENQVNLIYYGARPTGIWAVIEAHSDGHVILSPNYRPYPLYKKDKILTNLPHEPWPTVPNFISREEVPTIKLTLDQAAEQILIILKENIQNILENNKIGTPKVMFSGGIDSLSAWAILDSLTQNYILHASEPNIKELYQIDYETAFKMFHKIEREYTSPFIETISKQYWGYKLTGINSKPQTFLTGFWGDEIMFRGPPQIDLLAKVKGSTAKQIAKPDDYTYEYLNQADYKQSDPYDNISESEAFSIIEEWLSYDFQMWHLDNHIHYSPYFDIRIFEVMKKLSLDDILLHGRTAIIQTKIIDLVNPKFNLLRSTQKNTPFNFDNYTKNKHEIPHILDKLVK
jgi:hypothetical protein